MSTPNVSSVRERRQRVVCRGRAVPVNSPPPVRHESVLPFVEAMGSGAPATPPSADAEAARQVHIAAEQLLQQWDEAHRHSLVGEMEELHRAWRRLGVAIADALVALVERLNVRGKDDN